MNDNKETLFCSFILRVCVSRTAMSRTAICMTGMPRSLFLTPDQLAPSLEGWVSKLASTNRDLKEYTRITDWAGFPAGPHPEWLVARSIRNHVLNVLSVNGGFDLFVIEPGTRRSIGWEEALSSSIRQQRQAADRVMVWGRPTFRADLGDICFTYLLLVSLAAGRCFSKFLRAYIRGASRVRYESTGQLIFSCVSKHCLL